MKTFVQISFHFEFKVSELNATSSTAISRFWGRLLSGTVVPITLTITHHKTKFAFPMQIPKNMLGTTCHSDSNDVTSTATSLINNAKLKNIEFFANSETTCYSVYDITMDLNNIMPYYLELSDKESNVGCAYLYKGNSIVESSEFISIGCGNFLYNDQTNTIEKAKALQSVELRVNTSSTSQAKYEHIQNYITQQNIVHSNWNINVDEIIDGKLESQCNIFESQNYYNLETPLDKWGVAIIGKSNIHFESYLMQVDNLIYPAKLDESKAGLVDSNTIKVQFDKAINNNHHENYTKLRLIDVANWGSEELAYGDTKYGTPDSHGESMSLNIDGAGFAFVILFAFLGCCGSIYSCLSTVLNCKLCPCYRKYIQFNMSQQYSGEITYPSPSTIQTNPMSHGGVVVIDTNASNYKNDSSSASYNNNTFEMVKMTDEDEWNE